MVYIKDPNQEPEKSNNKRRYDRRHSLYYLRIYDSKNDELIGNLVDLSEGGLMMVGDKPLKTGTTYSFSMQLPVEGEGADQHQRLEFNAVAKWSKPESNPSLFDTGLELVGKSDELTNTIRQLIDAYMFNSY